MVHAPALRFTLVDTSPRSYHGATVHGARAIDWKAALAAARAAWGKATAPHPPAAPAAGYERLSNIVVTAGVGETLFGEYAAHRATDRGGEEIGWLLLGIRDRETVTVVATLPAGAGRDAGQEHVRFNADAQAVGGRILRREDKRLVPVGVAHTHPGTLRHPSRGDYLGDRDWVSNLRGGDGVFAIGTADGPDGTVAVQLEPNSHARGGLRFDWYGLAAGDDNYRPLPVGWTLGPDLGAVLRPAWPAVEAHAARVENLARQLQGVAVQSAGDAIIVTVPVAGRNAEIRAVLFEKSTAFVYTAGGRDLLPDLPAATPPDAGVFLLLAELAGGA